MPAYRLPGLLQEDATGRRVLPWLDTRDRSLGVFPEGSTPGPGATGRVVISLTCRIPGSPAGRSGRPPGRGLPGGHAKIP